MRSYQESYLGAHTRYSMFVRNPSSRGGSFLGAQFLRQSPFVVGFLIFLSFSQASKAQMGVDWGTSALGQSLIQSDGTPITLSDFSVELGTFTPWFTPTLSNYDSWVSNWLVFDAITSGDVDLDDLFEPVGASPGGRFAGTANLLPGQTSDSEDANAATMFPAGSQAYVFIRNSDVPDEDAEWLLYTSQAGEDWEFSEVLLGQAQFPVTWFLSEVDTVLWGGANGGTLGGGQYTDTSTDFGLRTHNFVPEPSGIVFLFIGSWLWVGRRRRVVGAR